METVTVQLWWTNNKFQSGNRWRGVETARAQINRHFMRLFKRRQFGGNNFLWQIDTGVENFTFCRWKLFECSRFLLVISLFIQKEINFNYFLHFCMVFFWLFLLRVLVKVLINFIVGAAQTNNSTSSANNDVIQVFIKFVMLKLFLIWLEYTQTF